MALIGSFKRFVNANTCNANRNVESDHEQPFTIVKPNMDIDSVANPRKRSRENFQETVPTTHLLGKIMKRKLFPLLFQIILSMQVQRAAHLILEALICPHSLQMEIS